jgi:hypothetical protein
MVPAALDRGPHQQAADRDRGRDLDDQAGGPAVADDQEGLEKQALCRRSTKPS